MIEGGRTLMNLSEIVKVGVDCRGDGGIVTAATLYTRENWEVRR